MSMGSIRTNMLSSIHSMSDIFLNEMYFQKLNMPHQRLRYCLKTDDDDESVMIVFPVIR